MYLDTSRYTPAEADPPAATDLHVHAIKKFETGSTDPVFATPDKFQLLHAGLDNAWGDDFDRMS